MSSKQTSGCCSGFKFRWSMITVEPIVFLYMVASNLQFPTFQALVYKKTCLQTFNASFCEDMDNKTFQKLHKDKQTVIQGDASHWILLSNVGMTVPSILIVLLFVGSWGDRVNRKLPILIPCIGALIYNLVNLVNAYYMDWPLDYLMIGPVFNGLFGSYTTVLMGVYTYTTHVASANHKTTRVAIVESMTFIAGTISVFVSGLLLDAVGYVAVNGICCGCVGLASLYGVFCLKSIKPEPNDQRESCCQFWILGALADTVRCIRRPRVKPYFSILVLEIVILNIMQMCTTGENDILFLFLARSPRSFNSVQYGYFKGTENFTRSVALLTLLPVLKHCFHLRDTTVVLIGIFSKATGLVILGLAENLTMVFIVVVFAMLQGFPAAALRSNMSSLVDKYEQGRLFAIVAACEGFINLVTTLIFNGWYPKTLDTFDGTCFEFAAGLCGLALLITCFIHLKLRVTDQNEDGLKQLQTSGGTKLDTTTTTDTNTNGNENIWKTRL
ncbi:unnamed protein product [Candidula unifasciata]|uniref:Proton-coupled folate transporter n=1 Tax=Candidula unifasciata TaxID=100452 RepID=A0A8S3Z8W1_9EUPU|nr:unnamed protein product [Candidula unifasciata]